MSAKTRAAVARVRRSLANNNPILPTPLIRALLAAAERADELERALRELSTLARRGLMGTVRARLLAALSPRTRRGRK